VTSLAICLGSAAGAFARALFLIWINCIGSNAEGAVAFPTCVGIAPFVAIVQGAVKSLYG